MPFRQGFTVPIFQRTVVNRHAPYCLGEALVEHTAESDDGGDTRKNPSHQLNVHLSSHDHLYANHILQQKKFPGTLPKANFGGGALEEMPERDKGARDSGKRHNVISRLLRKTRHI